MRLPRFSSSLALLLAVVAVLMIAGMLAADLTGSRNKETADAIRQIEQHDRILAEHVATTFDSIEVLLDEMRVTLQEGSGWQHWNRATGHRNLKSHLTRSLPQIRHLIIFDADGFQRHASFAEAPPPINVSDRPYFRELADGGDGSRGGPFVGRNSRQPTYALARRLSDAAGNFGGALMVAIEPAYFENFCRSTRPFEEYEAAIVNAEGIIISSCRSPDVTNDPLGTTVSDDFRHGLAHGEFAQTPLADNRTISVGAHYLLATAPVPGYPDLRVVSATPKDVLTRGWDKHTRRILLLACVALAALVAAAVMIRRQLRRQAQLTRQLKASQENLEERIREATRELDSRRTDAERLAAAKSRFFAAASHDLRQPLHALQLFLGDLSRISDQPEQRVLIGRIEDAARAMAGQLRSMLDISRLDMASIVPEIAITALDAIFRQLETTYAPVAELAGVRLLFRPRAVSLETDPALLTRLLGNLIDNAIKFSPGGTVLVCARWRDSAVQIEVRDNGKGISSAHQQAIYDEFFQVGNIARDPGAGLGLGLAIANRLARLLGATLALRSSPGTGTRFALTLPCVNAGQVPPGRPPAGLPRLIVIGNGSETADFAEFAERAARWGYVAEPVSDMSAAWRMMDQGACIPVIIHPAGCALSAEIQSLLRQHPGVVITAADCAMPELGAYHLREPIKPARLRALLRSLH